MDLLEIYLEAFDKESSEMKDSLAEVRSMECTEKTFLFMVQ